jgi:hypothetical protein
VELQGKYAELLKDCERLRHELSSVSSALAAEKESNVVMRAMLDESLEAAEGIAVRRALRLVEAERQAYYTTLVRAEAVCEHLAAESQCGCGVLPLVLASLRGEEEEGD